MAWRNRSQMSAKLIRILTLASAVLVGGVWLRHKSATPSSHPSDDRHELEATVERAKDPYPVTVQSPGSSGTEPSIPAGTQSESAQEKHEAYVNERIAQLADLGMENDPDSLKTILSELTNRDPAVRKAALDAAIQFGSRDAIPAIQNAMLQADDPEEKAALAKGIDFLQLTNVTAVIEKSKR